MKKHLIYQDEYVEVFRIDYNGKFQYTKTFVLDGNGKCIKTITVYANGEVWCSDRNERTEHANKMHLRELDMLAVAVHEKEAYKEREMVMKYDRHK